MVSDVGLQGPSKLTTSQTVASTHMCSLLMEIYISVWYLYIYNTHILFGSTRVWTQGLVLIRQVLYTYSVLWTGSPPFLSSPLFKHYLVGFLALSSCKHKYDIYIYINKIHIMYFDLHPPFSLLLILPHTVPLSHSCPIIMIVITLGLDSAYERKHAIFDF
jgi:hypothetical protein